jgi:hypothetical protein
VYFSIEVNSSDSLFAAFFPVGFAGHGVLNKDSTVWIDRDRQSNNCIPPSILGNMAAQLCSIPTPKNTFASVKKLVNLAKSLFIKLKFRVII